MRTVNAAALALLARIEAGETIPAVQLLKIAFSPTEYYNTSGIDVEWGGQTWNSLGVSISVVDSQVGDLPNLTLSVSGVPSSALALALLDQIDGLSCTIYDALVDPDTGEVADAISAWTGTLNTMQIEDGAQAVIQITAEHRGVAAFRPKPIRYTDDAQREVYPGDTSLAFDPATDAPPLVWPAASFFRK